LGIANRVGFAEDQPLRRDLRPSLVIAKTV
jgi:hypothetical protein